jgi:6-phosphogluconolactonase
MSQSSSSCTTTLVVAATKDSVADALNGKVVEICQAALHERDRFIVALSGGSLPRLLGGLNDAFASSGVDPRWDQWHVLLADERCVPRSSVDSNMGALERDFLSSTGIPASQVHGISPELVQRENIDTVAVAKDYEQKLLRVLAGKDDDDHEAADDPKTLLLDLAVLGFGPDGHTCSLFPGHRLLEEIDMWVAPIDDSPKPPPKRITLTFPVLNQNTKHVIFCGAGDSKQAIVKKVFNDYENVREAVEGNDDNGMPFCHSSITVASPPPFPCAMVRPLQSLTWVVDKSAVLGKRD